MGLSRVLLPILLLFASTAWAQEEKRFCPEAYALVNENQGFTFFEPYGPANPPPHAPHFILLPAPPELAEIPLPPGYRFSSLATWEQGINPGVSTAKQLLISQDGHPVGLLTAIYDAASHTLRLLEVEVSGAARDQRLSASLIQAMLKLHEGQVRQVLFAASFTNRTVFEAGLRGQMSVEQAIGETPIGKALVREGYALKHFSLRKAARRERPDLPESQTESDRPPDPYKSYFWFVPAEKKP